MSDVRPGMQQIVAQLRKYGQASLTDEFNGTTYWTDEQLQDIADTRSERLLVKLVPVESSGRTLFQIKDQPRHYWFETDTYGVLQISDDDTILNIPTASVYTPIRAEVAFSEPFSSRYEYAIEGYATNLYMALADLWEQKAAQRYDYVDFKAGNNKVSLNQEVQQCLAMMAHYRNRVLRRHSRTGTGRWA